MNKLQKIQQIINVYSQLQKVAKTLHKMDEYDCNYGCTPIHETREKNLFKKAEALAQELGLHAYHQGDPRGGTLFLVEKVKGADTNYYTNGVYIQ